MSRLLTAALVLGVAWISWKSLFPITCAVAPTTDKSGIRFIEDDWDKALLNARTGHKRIFMDAYASWCGPCKLLKRTSFKNDSAARFFNDHYINLAMDMEKGIGPQLLEKFSISAYPTLLILDENGEVLHRSVGYIPVSKLIEFGQTGLK